MAWLIVFPCQHMSELKRAFLTLSHSPGACVEVLKSQNQSHTSQSNFYKQNTVWIKWFRLSCTNTSGTQSGPLVCLVSVVQSSAAQLGSICKFHWWNLLWWCRTYKHCQFFVFICIFMCRQMVSFNTDVEQMPRAAAIMDTMWPAFWSADALRSTRRSTRLSQVQRFECGPQ